MDMPLILTFLVFVALVDAPAMIAVFHNCVTGPNFHEIVTLLPFCMNKVGLLDLKDELSRCYGMCPTDIEIEINRFNQL